MKRLLLAVAVLAVPAWAAAETVVLKGGKRLDAASFQRQGNYVVVKLASGRVESYPVAAVDLDATRAANQVAAAPASPLKAAPTGPHSPFFGAQAERGKPVLVVTDQDVEHVVPPDDEEVAPGAGQQLRPPADGQVMLIDYSKQQIEQGIWEITATVINSGSSPVSSVVADVRLLDAEGKVVGTGTAALDGTLAPTQQAAVTARVAAAVEPIQIGFSFRWQSITPQPTPAPVAEAGGPAPGPAARPAAPVAAAPSQPAGYTVPPGSSPTTVSPNPNAVPSLLEPPTSLQVARPAESPSSPPQ